MTKSKAFTITEYQQELRSRNLEIQLIWTTEEVLGRRPDLNHKQAWQILLEIEQRHNRGFGGTRDVVDEFAQELLANRRKSRKRND